MNQSLDFQENTIEMESMSDKWNAFGGLMYLDTERVRTNKGTYDGYRVSGIPRFNAVAGLQYKPNNDLSLLARAV